MCGEVCSATGYAAGLPASQLSALRSDARRGLLESSLTGSAAGCEARLRLAGVASETLGSAPGMAFGQYISGQSPHHQGQSPVVQLKCDGEAKPRLTSGGGAG
jgi:hypothetical protein